MPATAPRARCPSLPPADYSSCCPAQQHYSLLDRPAGGLVISPATQPAATGTQPQHSSLYLESIPAHRPEAAPRCPPPHPTPAATLHNSTNTIPTASHTWTVRPCMHVSPSCRPPPSTTSEAPLAPRTTVAALYRLILAAGRRWRRAVCLACTGAPTISTWKSQKYNQKTPRGTCCQSHASTLPRPGARRSGIRSAPRGRPWQERKIADS